MDSLHSPVLGESASTCAPPGRRHYSNSSDSDDACNRSSEGSDVEDERDGSEESDDNSEHPPVSLLYRDKNKFYQNLLVNVNSHRASEGIVPILAM